MQHKKIKASMTELNNSIQQLILLVKYTAKHPHLIKKFFIEAMNHGLFMCYLHPKNVWHEHVNGHLKPTGDF